MRGFCFTHCAQFGRKLLYGSACLHGAVHQSSGKALCSVPCCASVTLSSKRAPACFEHFVPAANLRCSASMTRAQELSLRKNRLIVLPIFLNSLKSLQVVAFPAVFCVHLLVSQSFTGVVRLRQQPGASARARVHAASPAQPRRVQQPHPLPAAASGRFLLPHVPQLARE